jgi:dTDP-4-amino-4,6-dideoxygalactose transaminase
MIRPTPHDATPSDRTPANDQMKDPAASREVELLSGVGLLALDRQYAQLKDELQAAVLRVCESGRFVLGPDVAELEAELARLLGVPHVIGCASGSDALLLALMALGIGRDDEVLLPSYTFFATASAVTRLGALPVFVDIDPATFLIDPADLERKITPRSKAVIPVHLFGRTADLDAIEPITRRHGLPIVEDAAQSILSTWHGRCSGGLGDVGCFSFYPTKNLGGFGDGGFLTTIRDDLAESLRLLRVHGMEPRYYHKVVGINSRLDSIQAAVLRVKLPHLDFWTTRRQANAATYVDLFTRSGLEGRVVLPSDEPRGRHVWNQFVIRVTGGRRDELRTFLREAGVATEIYYPVPLHLQECFAWVGCGEGSLPATEQAARETLALPIFPELTFAEQYTVVARIAEFFSVAPAPPRPAEEPATPGAPPMEGPHFLRRIHAVGRADEVRC